MDKENLRKVEDKKYENKNSIVAFMKLLGIFLIGVAYFLVINFFNNGQREYFKYLRILIFFIKFLTSMYIICVNVTSENKLTWIFIILVLDIIGVVLYFLIGNIRFKQKDKKRLIKIENEASKYLDKSNKVINKFKNERLNDNSKIRMIEYINNECGYPLYLNDSVSYLETGEKFFCSLKEDLKNARDSIYLQFYILKKGKLLTEITDILKEKAKNGVNVNIVFDSLGSLFTKPRKYVEEMSKYGINIYEFNKNKLNISTFINFRDHRKIVVIDSDICYVGGVNIADEYVNIREKFGYWKDTGVRFTGNCVYSFHMMILKNIEFITDKKQDYAIFKQRNIEKNINEKMYGEGFIMPVSDGKGNQKNPLENVVISMINGAKNSIYISAPYLTLDSNIADALARASRSLVDVKIVVPHVPDKPLVHAITRAYYDELLEAGIKIYEYSLGFVHAKMMLTDECEAIIGSLNLDFRSLKLNNECMLYMNNTKEELKIKEDFEDMIRRSIEVKLDAWKSRNYLKKFLDKILITLSSLV